MASSALDEAEAQVIGIILDSPARIAETGLRPEMFGSATARKIFEAASWQMDHGLPGDPVSVAVRLEEMGMGSISSMTVVQYLLNLADSTQLAGTLPFWADKLRAAYVNRAVKATLSRVSTLERTMDGEELREQLVADLTAIDVGVTPIVRMDIEMGDEVAQIKEDLDKEAAGEGLLYGIPIGMGMDTTRLVPSGMPHRCVSVLCGDTKSGKSTTAQNIMCNVAREGLGVLDITIEDSKELRRQKQLSMVTGVPLSDIITRRLNRDDLRRLADVRGVDYLSNYYIEDVPGATAVDCIRKARRVMRSHNIKLVCIDYLQILERQSSNENEELRKSMLAFQQAAKADDCVYLVLSQLNRGHLKDREDPRPRKQDLYGSGSIEQFSKLILGVHIPSNYGGPKEGRHFFENEPCPSQEQWKKTLELWVVAQNRGEANIFKSLNIDWECGRMSDPDERHRTVTKRRGSKGDVPTSLFPEE